MTQTQTATDADREFDFKDNDFERVSKMVYDHAGIVLADHKRNMVYSRLSRRLRELNLNSFDDYLAFVQSDKGQEEVLNMINAITTNLTSFFREKHHFEFLEQQLKENQSLFANRKIRIWSAGCSEGMEVYSMAMTIKNALSDVASWDIKLLATDIDTNMLNAGSEGIYPAKEVDKIDPSLIRRYFTKKPDGSYQVIQALRDMVHFKKLNLMDNSWPVKGPFPIIFCRNVMIYFDKPTQKTLVAKFADLISDDGYLLVGHSENLFNMTPKLTLQGKTIYKRQ